MALELTFQIRLEGASKDVIVPKLKNLSYTVPFKARNVGDADSDPNFVMCVSIVPDNSAIGDRMNSLYRVPGVKQVDILQTIPLKGQRRWYGHFMIPFLISTVVFSLGVLTVLLDLVMDFNLRLDLSNYLIYLLIPAVISFWSGVGYIYYHRSY